MTDDESEPITLETVLDAVRALSVAIQSAAEAATELREAVEALS